LRIGTEKKAEGTGLVNSITITGPHLDRVNSNNTLEHWLNREKMDAGFGYEDSFFDLAFDSLACPILSPPSLEDVSDILQLDNCLDGLIQPTTLPEHTTSDVSFPADNFAMFCDHQLDDTFTSEDRWPI